VLCLLSVSLLLGRIPQHTVWVVACASVCAYVRVNVGCKLINLCNQNISVICNLMLDLIVTPTIVNRVYSKIISYFTVAVQPRLGRLLPIESMLSLLNSA
jgi:hypothetical protein